MRKAILVFSAIALLTAAFVVPAAAHHKDTPSPNHQATAEAEPVNCDLSAESADGPNTHVTSFTAVHATEEKTDDDHILGAPLGNNDNGYFTLEEFTISTASEEEETTTYPTCPSLTYTLVLFSSEGGDGYEVGRWSEPGNGTTTLEFFPGDDHATFYDDASYREACHYVETTDPSTGTVLDRTPDTGCATIPAEGGSGANSYR